MVREDGVVPRAAVNRAADVSGRRDELAAFLRSRRDRLAPEAVGLPPAPRRRTPGLRREEVAQLAGVGITWYTWLEQGRPINASAEVFEALARALLLDRHERAHLFALAGYADHGIAHAPDAVAAPVRAVLDGLDPMPARVVNARWDVLGYNRAEAAVMGDYALRPPEERNILWLLFCDPRMRELIPAWADDAAHVLAQFRASMAEHVGEPAWRDLVATLSERSADFRRMWQRHDVAGAAPRVKRLCHPVAGVLHFETATLLLADRPGARLSVHTPSDDATRAALSALVAGAAEPERDPGRPAGGTVRSQAH
jgi:transcriptional regulator with XRE-family HTH domain